MLPSFSSVITIIVLLILAGVSIAMLTGDNGILTQAQKAKEETEKAQVKEGTTLGQYESYLNRLTGNNAIVGEIVTEGNKPYTNNGTAIIPEGFAIVPGCEDVSQGLVISDKANDLNNEGNQFVWIPVTDENHYIRNTTYENSIISTTAYTDTSYLPQGIQPILDDSESNESAEKQAVLNTGGFYVSRYEAGKKGTNTLVSKSGATVWNKISQEDCKTTAKTFINNKNVKSALCSGIQWDVIMEFVDGKSDGMGNPFNVKIGVANRHTKEENCNVSGQNEADKVCNIYDLEGNCYEYIAEKNSYHTDAYIFVSRGGYYGEQFIPASCRYTYIGNTNKDYTFRFVLYVM